MLKNEDKEKIYQYLQNNLNCIKTGNFSEALNNCDKVLKIDPKNFDANYFIGAIKLKLKNYSEAINNIKIAIEINSNNYGAYNNLGVAYQELKNFEQAIEYFKKAIELNNEYAEAYNNLGNSFNKLGKLEEAIKCFNKAIRIKNNFHEAYNNLCGTFIDLYKYDEALIAINKALELNPIYPDALFNKGRLFEINKKFKDAFNQYCAALKINNNHIESLKHRSFIFEESNEFENALIDLNKILSINPDADGVLGNILSIKMKTCSWDNSYFKIQNDIENKILENKFVANPFRILAFTEKPLIQKKSGEIFLKNFKYKINLIKIKKNDKINIAYVSSDFGHHAVSTLIAGLIEKHNKNKFKIFGLSTKNRYYKNTDDILINQQYRERLIPAFDQFDDISEKNDEYVISLCKFNNIDIAIDLNGHTSGARTNLFLKRIAPIQINFIGFPGTMGSEAYDYIIADKKLIPDGEENFYSEKIIYMPDTYQPNDDQRTISKKKIKRSDFGLKEDSFVFCCLNTTYKINPAIFKIWMEILKTVNKSVLLLLETNKLATQNIIKKATEMNIDEERIIFTKPIHREEHIARFKLVDLFLDTSPYGGHTTISEALYAGLPVITYYGKTFASRVGASLLHALKMDELITYSMDDYKQLAIKLSSKEKIDNLKNKLNNNIKNCALFNTKLYTDNLEKAFQTAFENACSAKPVNHIYIN